MIGAAGTLLGGWRQSARLTRFEDVGTTTHGIDQREDYIQSISMGREGLGEEHVGEGRRGS